MRKARSSFEYLPDAPYHQILCHSAFGGPWPGMSPEELDEARALLFQHADFCSVEILAFSLRPTSFDLLLRIPGKLKLSKKEMLSRIEGNFSQVAFQGVLADLKSGDPSAVEKLAQNFGSVSFFLKRFKQVLTRNYHRSHLTSGVLWESRFDSTFVEPGHASRIVAAWVDHGFTRECPECPPEENPHCTVGWAAAGGSTAREMIRKVFHDGETSITWPATLKAWQEFRSAEPENPKTRSSNLNRKPPLTRSELMLHPVPHFHGGLAIGSHDFIQRLFEHNQAYFSDGREDGPRFIVGQSDPDLFTLRDKGDLRKPPRSQRLRKPD